MPTSKIIVGDAGKVLGDLPAESARCCVTSPPYWGLRDYGVEGQLGLERTPEEYVEKIVAVFREVRRVLADDGTLWLNLGDSYAANQRGSGGDPRSEKLTGGRRTILQGQRFHSGVSFQHGIKPKDLVGIPWRVAFALQADGWWLRSDIIWHKPNPMPESVTDRPTKAHEYLFLLSKSARYFYDAAAIAEPLSWPSGPYGGRTPRDGVDVNGGGQASSDGFRGYVETGVRNKRSVWTIATQPFPEAHFATFPTALVEPCILAGSQPGDTILDPFAGAGTTGLVASRLNRNFSGIELNPTYAKMAQSRILQDAPLLNFSP